MQAGGKEEAHQKEVSFHQFKIVLKRQLQSLNLDALLKVLAKSKGHRNPGKSQP